MPKFTVTIELSRTDTDEVDIEVEALDKQDAKRQALDIVNDDPNYDEWENADVGYVKEIKS